MVITQIFWGSVCEKVGDEKFFIAKRIVATFHCVSLKNPP
jgi:hypothetical protein